MVINYTVIGYIFVGSKRCEKRSVSLKLLLLQMYSILSCRLADSAELLLLCLTALAWLTPYLIDCLRVTRLRDFFFIFAVLCRMTEQFDDLSANPYRYLLTEK